MQHHMKWLGLRVTDKVTGFVGVVESISFDLYGCVQAVVKGAINDKNEVADGRWFDVTRLQIVSVTPVMAVPTFEKFHAPGPASKPAMPSNPTR